MCNNIFQKQSSRQMTCSPECKAALQTLNVTASNLRLREKKREENNIKYANVPDIPTCKLCGWKSTNLQSHLTTHHLTVQQYRDQYNTTNADIFHASYTKQKSDRMAGSKNPGYQHNGTMSSFSKNNKKYEGLSEADIASAISNQITKANITKKEHNSYTTSIEYYTSRGFTLDEASELRKQRQVTFSLEQCIEKYGIDEGTTKWKDRQRKWQATLDALPEEEKIRIEQQKMFALTNSYSKISQSLFDAIISQTGITDAMYGVNEKVIVTKHTKRIRPDFTVGDKIIEFNGDFWHANPALYDETSIIKIPSKKGIVLTEAGEIWKNDKVRLSILQSLGYKVHIVWEKDYKKDKQGTIQKCIDFLNR